MQSTNCETSHAKTPDTTDLPLGPPSKISTGGGPNYSAQDVSSKGSPQCSTSVSLVLTSITMSLISMFGGSTTTGCASARHTLVGSNLRIARARTVTERDRW